MPRTIQRARIGANLLTDGYAFARLSIITALVLMIYMIVA